MNLVEMQILFHQIIEDTNPDFFDNNRPNSYNVVNYLNQAITRYMQKKYLPFSTFKENHKHILDNEQDLQPLLRQINLDQYQTALFKPTGSRYGDNAKKYTLPDDFQFFVAAILLGSRSADTDTIMRFTGNEYQPCKLINHSEAERFYTTPINHPIMREPVVFFEEERVLNLMYDYETGDGTLYLVYVKKPFKMSFEYTELTSVDVSYISKEVRVLHGSSIYYPVDAYPSNGYVRGDRITISDGNYIFYPASGLNNTVGYPHDETNQCELPIYQHEDIVRLAIQMYMDEAKFKLMQKAEA